jgi:TPR repeat protein
MTSGFMRLPRHALVVMMLVAATPSIAAAATAGWLAYQRGDFAAARAAYEHDAQLGDRLAQFNLATMLLRGEGGAVDPGKGVDWLRKAAEAGMPQAQYSLGLLYESGTGVARSLTTATEWWERAAQQGHVDAQVQLGTQYFLGRGAPKDWTLAAKWYEAAAENGDAPDLKRALGWYLQAARQGDAGAALQADDVARRLGVAPPAR